MPTKDSPGARPPGAHNLFLGLGFSAPLRESLAQVGRELATRLPGARWHPTANLHLTLRYFGKLPDTERAELGSEIERIAASLAPFTLSVARLGFFGTPSRPRVLWVAPDDPPAGLLALSSAVREAFPDELARPFAPHVTLARFRGRLSSAHREACSPHLLELKRGRERRDLPGWARVGPFDEPVADLVLFASVPAERGVRYEAVAVARLG